MTGSPEARRYDRQALRCARYRSSLDRGADALLAEGRISSSAAALKAEARRRSDTGEFFGHISYASLIARRLR